MAVKRAAAKKVSRTEGSGHPDPQVAVCVIDGCNNPILHRGLCAEHWEDPAA